MKLYDHITPDLQEWAMRQSVFFCGSAPFNGRHINCSPKGLPATSFSILNSNLCAYVDATGSGIETIANILENGRVTIMFCSFDASPRILRFFCTGRVVECDQPEFQAWLKRMGNKEFVAARAVIVLDVFKVQTSCGFGVPRLALKQDPEDPSRQTPYLADRETLGHWGAQIVSRNTAGQYRAENNYQSQDGLPGLKAARRDRGEFLWYSDFKACLQRQSGTMYTIVVALTSASFTIVSMYLSGMTNLSRVS